MRNIPLKQFLADFSSQDNFVFLDTNRFDKTNRFSYLFTKPLDVISCYDTDLVERSIKKINRMLDKGYFAAGFVSYEAGFALEEVFTKNRAYDFPLLWFGIFEKPLVFDNKKVIFTNSDNLSNYDIAGIKPDISEKDYIESIKKIKKYIELGHTYQVNRTFKLNFSFNGSLDDLYLSLRRKQGVAYSAYLKFQNETILSFSPELFFQKEKSCITVKPMKGTMNRGRFLAEDESNADLLFNCPKNRSENIMILDLLRNDLGRISDTGTVFTKRFFETEKYESLWQMTSTAQGRVKNKTSLLNIFKSLFPSGSVTGAPKIRTMEIIDELEASPRRVYTGAIGFLTPEMNSVFNVAIRTLRINTDKSKGEMGVGSGIVYDSDPKKEYEECLLKARFMSEKPEIFSLIETMLWSPSQGYGLIDLHLGRLKKSAEYFNYRYSKSHVLKALDNLSKGFDMKQEKRIRLLLDKDGNIELTCQPLQKESGSNLITVSSKRTDPADKWLYFKTTNRLLYDSEYKKYKEKGFFDVVFKNKKNQITEGAISNIFIRKGGVYYTPPIECGVLDGVYRRHMLTEEKLKIQEKILYYEDLLAADCIMLSNAVRGLVEVRLSPKTVSSSDWKGVYA
jgi:para-aminobenzoate synthetase / 4-amino-4-deoxychorismate lyase